MEAADRAAALGIAERIAPLDRAAFAAVLDAARRDDHAAGDLVVAEGGPAEAREFFVLGGILKTFVGDAQGREVTLAFHTGPCVLTPSIARVDGTGRSRVNCVALTPCRIAGFPASALVRCMVEQPAIQRWGDAVLRAELVRRADREWALAALPALERLLRLRREHPGLEDAVAHHHIASYLGITPVTLSRLRAQLRARAGGHA